MFEKTIQPVIMAGGSGTRLWPVSRKKLPKQFQRLAGEQTMLQETASRVAGTHETVSFADPIIIGAKQYGETIADQFRAIGMNPASIVLEPCARNTAAVAAVAAMAARELHGEDCLVLLLPSDHHMTDPASFRDAVANAATVAAQGWITTFGIAPDGPETGYGYIRQGEALENGSYRVDAFVEKPDLNTAKGYIAEGGYTWNAGIFLFTAKAMLGELDAHAADILEKSTAAFEQAERQNGFISLQADRFDECRSDSVDYAVMEATRHAAVYGPLTCGWSDLGCWKAVSELSAEATHGDVISIDSEDSYLRTDGSVTIAAAGLKDMIVVAHEGTVLVVPKSRAQDVKKIVEQLKADGRADRL